MRQGKHTTAATVLFAAVGMLLPVLPGNSAIAQSQVRTTVVPSVVFSTSSNNRAVIGVTTGAGSASDTAGVRIEAVNSDGPAAKAGVREGMIITSVNGVSLRVSKEDAADSELNGLAQRRLTRTIQKVSVGDEVELTVLDGTNSRSIKVKTVSAADLAREPVLRIAERIKASSKRPSVGISIGVTGTVRDTAGLFVNSVVANGPAEKAGIVEGDRVVSINGVDLRVPYADYEDMPARMARVTRFNRELRKHSAGDKVQLKVSSGGRVRDVSVEVAASSTVPGVEVMRFQSGEGQFFMGVPEPASVNRLFDVRAFTRSDTGAVIRVVPPAVRKRVQGDSIVTERRIIRRHPS